MLKATVSGSFHRHMTAIYETVGQLRARGIDVLSPSDPRVVDHVGEFLFVASDRLRSVKLVQDRHLAAIRSSDFLWIVCPDGYTGPSTCMEIGSAVAAGVPVFANTPAADITIKEYVSTVETFEDAVSRAIARRCPVPIGQHALLDPAYAIDRFADALSDLRPALLGTIGDRGRDAERQLEETRSEFVRTFGRD